MFQIIRDFVCKQREQIYRGAFLCDIVIRVNDLVSKQDGRGGIADPLGSDSLAIE